jgi:hypothetical protein
LGIDSRNTIDNSNDRGCIISNIAITRTIYRYGLDIYNINTNIDRSKCEKCTIGTTYMVGNSHGRTDTSISIDTCSNDGNSGSILVDKIESDIGMVYRYTIDNNMARGIECTIGGSMWIDGT